MLISAAIGERPDSIIGSMAVGQAAGSVIGFSAAIGERPDSIIGSMSVGQAAGSVIGFSAAIGERPDSIIGSMSVGQAAGSVIGFSAAIRERPDSIIGSMRTGVRLICAVGATALLLRGVSYIFRQHRLYLDGDRYIVAAISGRPMHFKSGASANAWAELLITRAAAEVGYAAALPAVRRLVWKEAKVEALARYQDRLIQAAAKAVDQKAQQAIIDEINAVEAKIASI